MPRVPLAALSLCLGVAAQSPLTIGSIPTVEGPAGCTASLDVHPFATITLTQLTFWTGASTVAGTNVGLDVFLVGLPYSSPSTSSWLRLGSTVPQVAAGGAQQMTQALVPAPGLTSITLPAGGYQLALVANGFPLGLMPNLQNATDSFVWLHAQGSTTAVLPSQHSFTGRVHYTLGGTPTNLQETRSYGAGCGGLQLAITGSPALGGAVTYTVSGPVQPSLGVLFFSTGDLAGPFYPNGAPLDPFGATGCFAHTQPGSGFTTVVSNLASPAGMSATLTLPPIPDLRGAAVFAECAWSDPAANLAGWIFSNGVMIRIG